MSNIIKHTDQIILNLVNLSKYRAKQLENAGVQRALTEIEQEHCQLMLADIDGDLGALPLRAVDEHQFIDLTARIKGIAETVGIRDFEGNQAKGDSLRFLKTLKTYYKNLTFQEVELAFELLSLGKLDKWLPLENGQPNRSHYQLLGNEYIAKALNAFTAYKTELWAKVHGSVQFQAKAPTQAEIDSNTESMRLLIINLFDDYVMGKGFDFFAPFVVLNNLEKFGLIEEAPVVSHEAKQEALEAIFIKGNGTKKRSGDYTEQVAQIIQVFRHVADSGCHIRDRII